MWTLLKPFIEESPTIHRIYSVGTMVDWVRTVLRDDFLNFLFHRFLLMQLV